MFQADALQTGTWDTVFREQNRGETDPMIENLGRKRYPQGSVVFSKGDAGDSAFLIADGLVEISDPATGTVRACIGAGELIGEVALIDRQPRTATARTLKDTVLIEVPRDLLEQLLGDTNPIIRHLLNVVLGRFREAVDRNRLGLSGPASGPGSTTDMTLQAAAASSLTLLRDMRDAIATGEFVLHYQPIYRLEGRTLAGFEALIRWQHPAQGLVPPLTFLELAEESGLIREMGLWVVRQACQDWPALRRLTAHDSPFLSINISPSQLTDGAFAEVAIGIQQAAGIDPRELKLELTESTFIQNQAVAQSQLRRLSEFGNSIALDDYGTGFSGLAHLQNYRFNTLKLDQLFIREIQNSSLSYQLVMSTLDMIRPLNINAVGEGIETESVAETLQQLGCEYGQGYLFGKPMALQDLLAAAGGPADWTHTLKVRGQ